MRKLDLILLVDDNDADNEFHELAIKEGNIAANVRCIEDSFTALEYLKNSIQLEDNSDYPLPDLMFLDINMPAMNGFELLAELRELADPYGRRRRIKIFMLTGSVNPADRALAEGEHSDLVTGFRIKPLTNTTLFEIMQGYFSTVA